MSRTGSRTGFQLLIQPSGTGSRVQVRGHLVPDKRNRRWKTISGVGGCKMQAAMLQLKYQWYYTTQLANLEGMKNKL
jgi:hypothetical protein